MTHQICDIWGRVTREEQQARKSVLFSIRLAYLTRTDAEPPTKADSEEFSRLVPPGAALSDAYAVLTPEQRAGLRASMDNPPVKFINSDRTLMFVPAEQDVLTRLERGERVGPVDERQLDRPIGTKAF